MGEKTKSYLKYPGVSIAVLLVFFIVLHFVNRFDIYPIETIGIAASIMGVIGSIFAIYVAIQVPITIAKKQNDLALFEKRFEMLKLLLELYEFSNDLMKYPITESNTVIMARRTLIHWIMVMKRNINFELYPELGFIFKFNDEDKGINITLDKGDICKSRVVLNNYIGYQHSKMRQYVYVLPKELNIELVSIIDNYRDLMLSSAAGAKINEKYNTDIHDFGFSLGFREPEYEEKLDAFLSSMVNIEKIINTVETLLQIED